MKSEETIKVKEVKEIIKKYPFDIPINLGISPELKKQIGEMQKAARAISEAFKKQFEGIEQVMKSFGEALRKSYERFTPSLKLLADHGWYVCGASGISDGIELSSEISKGNIAKVDKFMVDFYEKQVNSIIRNAKEAYPSRVKVLNEAQLAHKNKMYHSSTLLFLSTADGIFSGHLFIKSRKGKPTLRKQLEKTKHLSEWGELLVEMSAIDAVYEDVNLFKSSLNRHKVMHGNDVDYGTQINSLKALSLLAFICDFFHEQVQQ